MDDPLVDPLIDSAIKRIEERVGHPITCPLCGGSEWGSVDSERFLRIWAPSELTDAEIDAPGADLPFDTIRALGLTCGKCGFLRLHHFSEEFGKES